MMNQTRKVAHNLKSSKRRSCRLVVFAHVEKDEPYDFFPPAEISNIRSITSTGQLFLTGKSAFLHII